MGGDGICIAKVRRGAGVRKSARGADNGTSLLPCTQTGSGKTLGFAVPALARMHRFLAEHKGKRSGPLMLVLAPTRELAQQSNEVIRDLCKVPCHRAAGSSRSRRRAGVGHDVRVPLRWHGHAGADQGAQEMCGSRA
jgi:hypothetical protein